MKKIILGALALIVISGAGLFVLNGKSNYESEKYSLAVNPSNKNFSIGSQIDFVLPDQFDKSHTLDANTKKLIFAFTKDTGHIIKEFMADRTSKYLTSKQAVIVADISAMPVVIQNTFALPDLRESDYSMMLIYDKEMAIKLKQGQEATKVIVMTLVNKKVTKVEHASDAKSLENLLK